MHSTCIPILPLIRVRRSPSDAFRPRFHASTPPFQLSTPVSTIPYLATPFIFTPIQTMNTLGVLLSLVRILSNWVHPLNQPLTVLDPLLVFSEL